MDELKVEKYHHIYRRTSHHCGSSAAEGAMDASNIFKPALSRGELQCIEQPLLPNTVNLLKRIWHLIADFNL